MCDGFMGFSWRHASMTQQMLLIAHLHIFTSCYVEEIRKAILPFKDMVVAICTDNAANMVLARNLVTSSEGMGHIIPLRYALRKVSNSTVDNILRCNDIFIAWLSCSAILSYVNELFLWCNTVQQSLTCDVCLRCRCMMHGFGLVLGSVVSHAWAKEVLVSAQGLVTFFRSSHKPLGLFRETLNSLPVPEGSKKKKRGLVTSNQTRMTSQQMCLQSIVDNEVTFRTLLQNHPDVLSSKPALLTLLQDRNWWTRIDALNALLEPFSKVIMAVQAERSSMADVARYWIFLARELPKVIVKYEGVFPLAFQQHIVYSFNKRVDEMDRVLGRLALFLDPRYKEAVSKQLFKGLLIVAGQIMNMWGKSKEETSKLMDAMELYEQGAAPFHLRHGGPNFDSLAWWEGIGVSSKCGVGEKLLAELATILLGAVPHSAATERLFSMLKWFESGRRVNLAVHTLSMLSTVRAFHQAEQKPAILKQKRVRELGRAACINHIPAPSNDGAGPSTAGRAGPSGAATTQGMPAQPAIPMVGEVGMDETGSNVEETVVEGDMDDEQLTALLDAVGAADMEDAGQQQHETIGDVVWPEWQRSSLLQNPNVHGKPLTFMEMLMDDLWKGFDMRNDLFADPFCEPHENGAKQFALSKPVSNTNFSVMDLVNSRFSAGQGRLPMEQPLPLHEPGRAGQVQQGGVMGQQLAGGMGQQLAGGMGQQHMQLGGVPGQIQQEGGLGEAHIPDALGGGGVEDEEGMMVFSSKRCSGSDVGNVSCGESVPCYYYEGGWFCVRCKSIAW
jgi:hypothetical protein